MICRRLPCPFRPPTSAAQCRPSVVRFLEWLHCNLHNVLAWEEAGRSLAAPVRLGRGGGQAREDCPSAAHGSGQATSHCSLAARPPQCLDPALLGAPPFRHLSGALHLSRAQGCEKAAMRPCSHKRDPFVLKGQGVGWDRDSRLHPTPTQAPGGVGC